MGPVRFAAEPVEDLHEMGRPEDLQLSDQGGFGKRLRRDDGALRTAPPRGDEPWEDTTNRADAAVQRQLAQEHRLVEALAGLEARGGEYRTGERDVVARTAFRDGRGRQRQGDQLVRPFVVDVADRGPDSLLGLVEGRVG